MNHASAIKFIKDHKDTPRFAILPIDEKTFPKLVKIKKYGTEYDYQLAIKQLYESFQAYGFDKLTDASCTSMLITAIRFEDNRLLDAILEHILPHFTEDEEITAWNLFVRESEFMKELCEQLGLNWDFVTSVPLQIHHNTYKSLKTAFGHGMDKFVKKHIGEGSEYYFGDKWFVLLDGEAYSENTLTDMINTLLTKFFEEQIVRNKIFDEWQDWMSEHHDDITITRKKVK